MKRGYIVLALSFLFLLLPLGTGSEFNQPLTDIKDISPNGNSEATLSDFPVSYSGKGAALDVSVIGTYSSNSSQWTESSTSYADDLTQGTSFSVSNASSVSWSANALVSPPSGVDNVNFSLVYNVTDWKPVSLTNPIGVSKTYPTDWWYQAGVIYTSSSAIDTYGMWRVTFTGTNHLNDLSLGLSGGSLGTTEVFDISNEMKLQSDTSWITGATVGFELSDPSGTTWYTASNTTFGSTTHEIPSFVYRKDITVDNTKVFEDLTEFPLVINILDTDLHADVQSDGDDILFVQNGMIVPHEIEEFDQNFDSTRARLIAWIKVNLSSSVDTTISMYYGNPTVGPLENPEAVWSTDYTAVWHLDENAVNEQTSTIHDNSVSGEHDGNQDGNARVAGRIGYGQDFDGTDDLINVTEERGLDPIGDVTLSGWFRLDSSFTSSSATSMIVMEKYFSPEDNMHIALVGTDYTSVAPKGSLVFKIENNDVRMYKWTQGTSWTAGTWYYFVCTMDSSNADNNRIYINGVDNTNLTDSGSSYAANLTFTGDWGIGGGFADGQFPGTPPQAYLDGRLDEVRVINSIPSNNWILTEYTNQVSTGTFYSSGTESPRTSPDLSIKKTVDSSADAGVWKATARYNDSGSFVSYRVGFYQRDFTVKRNTQFELLSPGDAVGDGVSEKVVGDVLYIEIQLDDTLSSTGIEGATVSMNWTVATVPTNIDLESLGTGRYGKALNTSDLDTAMRWRINIQATHDYYNPSSTFIDLDLYHPTELTYKYVSSTPVGDDFTATLEYRDTWSDVPISGATITFANGTAVNVIAEANGEYNISIPTSILPKGNHWYILNATKSGAFMEIGSSNITFTLRAHYTAISVIGDLITPFGEDTALSIVLVDLDTGGVLDETYVTSFSFTSSYGTEGDAGPSPADLDFTLATNSWSLGETSVTLSLVLSDADYLAPDNYVFDITIRPHYTSVSVTGVVTQPFGNATPITVIITDLDTGTQVTIGNVAHLNFTSSYGDQNETANSFDIVLTTDGWSVGQTIVTLSVSMSSSQYYAPSNYQFQITIQSMDIYLYHDPIDLIFPSGDDFVIYLRVNVSEPGTSFGLPVQGLTQGEFSVPSYVISIDATEQSIGRYKLTIASSYFGDGDYTITVFLNPSNVSHASTSLVIHFTYRPARSFLASPNYPQITTPFGMDVQITLNYTDVDRDLGILGATIGNESINIYGVSEVGNGVYTVWVNVTGLAKGSHQFNLTADAGGYEFKYLEFTVLVRAAFTYAIPTVGALDIPVGNDPVFYVTYWDIDNDVSISNETPFQVTSTWIRAVTVTYIPGEERYRIDFITEDTDTLEQNRIVTFNFSKGENYQFGIFNISVTLRTHTTDFRLVSAVEPTSFNGIINISVYYGDIDNGVGITPLGSIGYTLENTTGSVIATLVDDPQGDGYYILRIDANQFGLGLQTFNITFSWTGGGSKYQTKLITETANVIGEDSRLSLLVSSDPTAYLEIMSYTFLFSDLAGSGITNTSNPYGDGNVLISVSFQGLSVDLSQVQITEVNHLTQAGNYSISFNNSILGEIGLVYMNVYINWTAGVAPYYTNRADVLSVRVLARDTLLSIAPPSPTSWGENASFTFTFDDVTGGGNVPIANASSLSISLSLSTYWISYDSGSKTFTITFDTSQSPIGDAPLESKSFTLDVTWEGEPFYTNHTGRTVFVTVITRQTVLDYQSPAPTQYLDNVTFTVTWTDVTGASIAGISVADVFLFDGLVLIDTSKYTVYPDGTGNYTIELNTTYKATPGIFDLRLDLNVTEFYIPDISATRQFNIRYRVTLLSAVPTDKLPYNSSLEFIINFQDLYTLTPINNDSFDVTFQILNGSSWSFTINWQPAFEYYILTVDTYNQPSLVVNTQYNLHIQASYSSTSPFYGSDDAFILFELRTRTSALDLETAPDTTPYLNNASFQVYYRDVDSSLGITAETVTVNKGATPLVLNTEYWVTDNGNGYYTIIVNSVALDGLGLTLITVFTTWNPVSAPYHDDAQVTLSIRVSQRETNVEIISPPPQTNYLNNVTFTFAYFDLLLGTPIATITESNIQVWADGSQLSTGEFVLSGVDGTYTLQVNSTLLSPNLVSNYNLTIFVDWNDGDAPYYYDDTTLVRVTIIGRVLSYSPQPIQTANFGENLTVSFLLFDAENSNPVSGAIILFDCQTVSLFQRTDFWISESAGKYTIEIDSLSLLSPDTFLFDLNITWDFGVTPYYTNMTTIETSATIRPISTDLTASSQTISVEWKQGAAISVTFYNYLYLNDTSGATVTWFWGDVGIGGNFTEIGISGVYIASIDTSLTSATGTTIITIQAEKPNYEDATTFVTLIIETLPSELSIIAPEEAIVGIIFIPRGSGINITIYLEDENNAQPISDIYVLGINATLEGSDFLFTYNGTPGYYESVIPGGGPTILEIGSTYNVRFTASLNNYNPASGIFKISLLQAQTSLDLAEDTTDDVVKVFSEFVNFTVHLYAPDLLFDIDNASVVWLLSEKGLFGNLTWLGYGGLYYVTFNTSEVGFGIWGISFRATPDDPIYSNSATRLSLTINRIPTDVIREFTEIEREWGWTGNVTFIFNTTLFGPVTGAIAGYSWSGGSGNATDLGNGTYLVPIDTAIVAPGSYTLTLTFSKENYQEGPTTLRIEVEEVDPELSIAMVQYNPVYDGEIENPLVLLIPIGDSVTIYFWYNDTDPEDGYVGGLAGAESTFNSYLRGPSIDGYLNVSLNDERNGLYSYTFSTTDAAIAAIIDSESYRLYFEVFLENRKLSDIQLRIQVIEIPTELILTNPEESFSFVNGEGPTLIYFFNDTWHNQGITGAQLNANSSTAVVTLSVNEIGEGIYEVELISGQLLNTGGGVVVVNVDYGQYATQRIDFVVDVRPNTLDDIVISLILYALPLAIGVMMLMTAYVRVWSVPKKLRQINGQIKTIRKGKIPKPLSGIKMRQQLVADLFNDTYSEVEITRTASQMPEETIPIDIPEMGELLVQLAILTNLSSEELDEFKADIAKMKMSEQAAFVREVIEQEAIRAARREGKTTDQILTEVEDEASRRIAGDAAEAVAIPSEPEEEAVILKEEEEDVVPTLDRIIKPEPTEPVITEPSADVEDRLSMHEIEELRSDLLRKGVPDYEINTLIEQAKTLPRDLVEELIKSLDKEE